MQSSYGVAVRTGARRRGMAALLVSVLLLAACGDDSDEPEDTAAPSDRESLLGPADAASGDPLRIGFITDGQSALVDTTIEFEVADATVAYLNAHRGGIAGRPVELVTCSSQNDPSKATDCANQMVAEGVPVVAIGTTGVYESVWRPLHDAGVPTVFYAGSGDAILGDETSSFSFVSPTASNIELPLSTAMDNELEKVTVVVIDVPAAVVSYEGGGEKTFEDEGIELELVRIAMGTADMTPQLQQVVSDDPGVIHVIGNDAFCISAYQALQALGFDGPITSIGNCITDGTRQALTGGYLEGVRVALTAPSGSDEDASALYQAVVAQFAGGEIDLSQTSGVNAFVLLAGLDVALDGLEGEVTPESVISTMRSMPESDLPGAGGIRFRCDGKAVETAPATCTNQGLFTSLDADGNFTDLEVTSK